jgi:hypothetical protein
VEAGQCGSPTIEQQLQIARDAIQEAENRPPCKLIPLVVKMMDSMMEKIIPSARNYMRCVEIHTMMPTLKDVCQ